MIGTFNRNDATPDVPRNSIVVVLTLMVLSLDLLESG